MVLSVFDVAIIASALSAIIVVTVCMLPGLIAIGLSGPRDNGGALSLTHEWRGGDGRSYGPATIREVFEYQYQHGIGSWGASHAQLMALLALALIGANLGSIVWAGMVSHRVFDATGAQGFSLWLGIASGMLAALIAEVVLFLLLQGLARIAPVVLVGLFFVWFGGLYWQFLSPLRMVSRPPPKQRQALDVKSQDGPRGAASGQ